MPRPAREVLLRHESEPDTESFVAERKSAIIVTSNKPKKGDGRGKRSLEDMMSSMATDEQMAVYVLDRIAGLEDQIVKIFSLCTPGAAEMVLKRRESLRKYADAAKEQDSE